MIEGMIFDMDGVIIDSHPVHLDAWSKFLASVGKTVSNEELGFILEGRRREEILRHFLGHLPFSKIVEYGHQKDLFFQENFHNVKLIPGVCDLLEKLEILGLEAAIATSASAGRTWGTLRRLGLHEKFVAIISGDDVHAGKPDPAVYTLAAERMNLSPEKLLVLEDAPCGVQAAKSAGMRCIGISTNGRAEVLRQCGAEFVIPDFCNDSIERLLQLSSCSSD
jgi:HAD superfamily hydrolase (TIGR01509 family)